MTQSDIRSSILAAALTIPTIAVDAAQRGDGLQFICSRISCTFENIRWVMSPRCAIRSGSNTVSINYNDGPATIHAFSDTVYLTSGSLLLLLTCYCIVERVLHHRCLIASPLHIAAISNTDT